MDGYSSWEVEENAPSITGCNMMVVGELIPLPAVPQSFWVRAKYVCFD
jgi:hypothetical protein